VIDALLLGSGGWIPTRKRETCSAYFRLGNQVMLIDAGTAIQHLVERPELVADAERVDIVLTHFHLDHVVGLSYLPALSLPEPPTIWGPGVLLAGASTAEILDRLLTPPLFSVPPNILTSSVREVPARDFNIGSFALATRVQRRHSEPTIAIRLGNSLAYCTDTASDPENVGFAAGCRTLLHEASYPQASSNDGNHSAGGDAGRIAHDAGVDNLVLIHISPLLRSDDLLVASAAAEFPPVAVGVDLAPIPLD
jgi:ribonuclease BN (tRNA processing enzyme)